ncbi:MAG: hypothetical protein ACFFD8_07990 [Candidatus Thorarchaeota archaeon]
MNPDEVRMGLRQVSILERNAEYHDAAAKCFSIYSRTQNPEIAIRGFENLSTSIWHANSLPEVKLRLSELIQRVREAHESMIISQEQYTLLEAMSYEAQGWLPETPNAEKLIEAIERFKSLGKFPKALNLISSLIAFLEPAQQVIWAKQGNNIAAQLSQEEQSTYFILLVEPLVLYAEREEKQELLQTIFHHVQNLSQMKNRSHLGNIAVIHGLDLIYPHRVEVELAQVIRQDNVHELARSLVDCTHNRIRGMILSLLGSSYYRMAENEEVPELRQELYKKAKDYFLQSVTTLERTPTFGELFHAYTLAGTGFLSIAELEQDFTQRNEFYRLGEEFLRKSQQIGKFTQLYHLRARAAINLGVALERIIWFDMNPESRKERLMEIYNLQLEGRDLAEQTKELRGAGYATMNASEMCGFLSDLETRSDKKRDWAKRQRELSQTGLELLEQTPDNRGKVVALSYAAFGCAKLADLSHAIVEKQSLYEEMLRYGERAQELAEDVPDPVATAYAYQQAGDAAHHLGVLVGKCELLHDACKFYEKAVKEWSKTGERHKLALAMTQHADTLLFLSSLDFTPSESVREKLLSSSEKLHLEAAELHSKLFFFHDMGENYWRIGQIHLLREDYSGAQECFNKVQWAFDQVSEIVPDLAEVYSIFSTFGVTFVGLVDGLNIINQGNYAHAGKLFKDLAEGLDQETDRSLRQLRQLLVALTSICQFALTNTESEREIAKDKLDRLLSQLSPDAYEQQLPYSLHKTIHRLHIFLIAPKLFFPPLLLDLPLKDKMMVMAQTRHIVSTAFNLYQSTTRQLEASRDEPSENVIRNYVEKISDILANR